MKTVEHTGRHATASTTTFVFSIGREVASVEDGDKGKVR